VITATSFDPETGNGSATDRYTLAPVGGVTLASGRPGLLARWLALVGVVLLVGGALLAGRRMSRKPWMG